MRARIASHQARRVEGWRTINAPLQTGPMRWKRSGRTFRFWSTAWTLWLSNHMLAENDVDAECARLVEVLSKPRGPWFVVSNEVGQGIVPENALARRFRDAQGRLKPDGGRRRRRGAAAGRRHSHEGEVMTEIDEAEAERHRRQDGEAQGGPGRRRYAEKTIEKGILIRQHRSGKGQVDRRLRPGAEDARPWPARRRGAVRQGRLAHWGKRTRSSSSATSSPGTSWAKALPGKPQDLERDIAAAPLPAWDKVRELLADETISLLILDELGGNIALALRLPSAFRGGRGTAGQTAGVCMSS